MKSQEKNKKIKEIEKILDECNRDICKIENTCSFCKATILYNAGYRKKSEVAKEIFEKIFKIYNLINEPKVNEFGDIESGYVMIRIAPLKQLLQNLAKKYEVEL